MRRPRLPKEIRLPFGYRIEIRYRTGRQLKKLGLDGSHGCWYGPDRAIYIRSDDHVGEQCETIAHELEHASTDYRHWVDMYVRMPLIQESAETALDLAEEDD
jgi:hypothetical protein